MPRKKLVSSPDESPSVDVVSTPAPVKPRSAVKTRSAAKPKSAAKPVSEVEPKAASRKRSAKSAEAPGPAVLSTEDTTSVETAAPTGAVVETITATEGPASEPSSVSRALAPSESDDVTTTAQGPAKSPRKPRTTKAGPATKVTSKTKAAPPNQPPMVAETEPVAKPTRSARVPKAIKVGKAESPAEVAETLVAKIATPAAVEANSNPREVSTAIEVPTKVAKSKTTKPASNSRKSTPKPTEPPAEDALVLGDPPVAPAEVTDVDFVTPIVYFRPANAATNDGETSLDAELAGLMAEVFPDLQISMRSRVSNAPVTKADDTTIADEEIIIIEGDALEGFDFATFDLPIPAWRSTEGKSKPTPEAKNNPFEDGEPDGEDSSLGDSTDEDSDTEDEGSSVRGESDESRRKRRRKKRGKPGPSNPAVVAKPSDVSNEPTPAVKEKPIEFGQSPVKRDRPTILPPEKASIAIPIDAPQVVIRDGVPTLVRNHRVYPPIMFFGSPADERRAETVLEQVKMAAEAGVHLHSYLIDFEVDENSVTEAVKFAAFILSRSVQSDPESQVIFRLVLRAPRNWNEKYPKAVYRNTDGSLAEPSVCDEDFWTTGKNAIDQFVRQMRLLHLKDHILGLHLERGEWFFAEGSSYDNSLAAQAKFREWVRVRYANDDVTLRASWFDGGVNFDTIKIPQYEPEGQEGERFIRSSRRQRRFVDYHLFLSDATVQRISELAYAAKAASEGYFLIGASYGYTFEWSHPASGHLSLGKLLRTPEIDFIAGPPSYRNREPGGSAAFPSPIDSFALNGKLYISEEDFKTSLSVGHEPDDFNPQLKTPQALESVQWRGAGAALAHASGVAWMDLWGNGWLRTHSVWERAKKVREALTDRLAAPFDDPEVAIFIDERALAYLVDTHAFQLLVQNVRESVLRAGVSAAFYLLSDLAHREKFPESKLYIFVNAWDIRPELRASIKSRLQRDNKVLFWLYAAGLFDAGRDSLERAREVTGIALKPQPFFSRSGTTIINRRHPLSEAFPEKSVVGGSKLEPSYFAIPEGATILGEYSQTGLPSFVVKEFKDGAPDTHWTSVFLGEPLVNPALIRALAQMAGAHVWNFHEDVVHVRHPFCTVHCKTAGPRTVTLPGKFSAYNLLNDEWSAVDSPNVRFNALEGSTHCFLVGPRDELQHRLHADPRIALHIEELPKREANIRVDGSTFDVPIMKIGEWMGSSDSDDNADEWFLRPQQIEEEPLGTAEESPERVGRRRRKRGNGRNEKIETFETNSSKRNGNGGAGPGTSTDYDDVALGVMFRKRD